MMKGQFNRIGISINEIPTAPKQSLMRDSDRRKSDTNPAPLQKGAARREIVHERSECLSGSQSEKGQAFVETVLIFPVMLLLIVGIVQFSQISITQQRLLMAARHGVWLMGRGQSTSVVQREIKDFLVEGKPSFIQNRIRITCSDGGGFGFDRVTVSYELRPSPLLRPILGSRMTLSEHCVVLGGTWYWGFPS